ncbi:MAG: hypothetical protein AB8B84_16230 [Granulosicoccus sp.]
MASSKNSNQTQQTDNIDKAMERGCATTHVFINIATVLGRYVSNLVDIVEFENGN